MEHDSLHTKDMLETSDNFEDAYRTHSGPIYKFLFWRTKDTHLSEDLTSATFQKAWTSRRSFKGGSVQAWLYRIARNTLYDHWRKTKELTYEDVPEVETDKESISDQIDKRAELEQLEAAVDKLPAEMKTVIRLRFIEGLSAKQVAQKLAMSDGNVRVIQYRALKKLQRYLQ